MPYTTINKSTDYFNTKLYTGNGSTNAITGVGFQPDWVWIKNRVDTYNHHVFDVVRGVNKQLQVDSTGAESTFSNSLTSFDSDGFTLGSHGSTNYNGNNHVSWNWKAGTTSGITTNGSTVVTPSAYSFNQTSGFSIVKYAGNGNTTTKVAHGLGAAPKWIIIKNLDDGSDNWKVYHVGIGNTTAIQLDNTGTTSGGSDHFYDTDPDTVNFTLGNHVSVNNSGENYIAYCFAEKTGYSKFSDYTGNGSADGTFVYTGFKPAFVLSKNTTATQGWFLIDNKRANAYNPVDGSLHPNSSAAEDTSSDFFVDFYSNGFKVRDTDAQLNASGNIYIYMAFAEAPLVGSNNIPSNAR